MAKDPAFLFYSQDFFTGTAIMDFEDKGKFIHILCLMHQQGRMSEKTIRFIVGSISDNLKSKFRIDKNGFWYNERLELESQKRASFTKSRYENGLKGGRPKKETKPYGYPKHNHMGNENENEIDNINKEIEKPLFLWTEVVKSFNNDFRWKEKFCRDKKIRLEILEQRMNEFINDLELKEDFKELKDLKNHFTNWFNKNKITGRPAEVKSSPVGKPIDEVLKRYT